jgi:hypothetical protein
MFRAEAGSRTPGKQDLNREIVAAHPPPIKRLRVKNIDEASRWRYVKYRLASWPGTQPVRSAARFSASALGPIGEQLIT